MAKKTPDKVSAVPTPTVKPLTIGAPIAAVAPIGPLVAPGAEEPPAPLGRFDVEGKPREWHTAFYYLAEHVRAFSDGALNHKALYAYVGTDGRYINHDNPLVRKRTAGALSRIIHSKRYAADMRDRYAQNSLVYDSAAREICGVLVDVAGRSYAEIAEYLMGECWTDVRHGLENEQAESRPDLNLMRIDQEMKALFTKMQASLRASSPSTVDAEKRSYAVVGISGSPSAGTAFPEAPVQVVEGEVAAKDGARVAHIADMPKTPSGLSPAESILSALFHILAFGSMDFTYARTLVNESPTGAIPPVEDPTPSEDEATHDAAARACLIKFHDEHRRSVENYWVVRAGSPFTIGRYTDCNIIESDPAISRMHGVLYKRSGQWFFEDMGSRNGSRVMRSDGQQAYASATDGTHVPVKLNEGDMVVLAERSFFWFGALDDGGYFANWNA